MQTFPPNLTALAEDVLQEARKKKIRIATAESCTGGLIAGCLTEISGSSAVFDRGFVVYSNDAKMTNLDVSRKTLQDFGSVSAETALEMALGALRASNADLAIAATGIAGPDGGSAEKPVGLVYLGIALRKDNRCSTLENKFKGDRVSVRLQTVEAALAAIKKEISEQK
jgi:nicotinamide-nucleotide amidase